MAGSPPLNEINPGSRPGSRKGPKSNFVSEDELTAMMNATELEPTSNTNAAEQSSTDQVAGGSHPVPIIASTSAHVNDVGSSYPTGARSATPTSTAQFALAAGIISPDGPMTPRNDVGPFILDGSGSTGRHAQSLARIAVEEEREESESTS